MSTRKEKMHERQDGDYVVPIIRRPKHIKPIPKHIKPIPKRTSGNSS